MGEQIKRLLILHHYNPHNGLSSYVPEILRRLRPLYKEVVVVSNSKLSDGMVGLLTPYSQQVIQRENKGFDFGGWRDALLAIGWSRLQEFDTLTLMNDTCFGPLFDMQSVFDQMDATGADFWGITLHPEKKSGMPRTIGSVPVHLQSYFMSFSNNVFSSKTFRDFWQQVKDCTGVNEVIRRYETRLTGVLAHAGFTYEALMNQKANDLDTHKLAIFQEPDKLLKYGCPFMKTKSLLFFESPAYLVKLVGKHSDYGVSLIEEYFFDVHVPNISVNISNKNIFLSKERNRNNRPSLSVAMHFHVFYVDVFERHIMKLFDNNNTPIDLYITTDSGDKKERIMAFAAENNIEGHIREIMLVENRGRDVFPWLQVAPLMKHYDIAGHFHTKKTVITNEWVGESWMDELTDTLFQYADEVISLITSNEHVGIVIPDIPLYFKSKIGICVWGKTRVEFMKLWGEMNLPKSINPMKFMAPVMSYGNMFWYRPAAIEPLWGLELTAIDFPAEPLPIDGSIAHAFESLPVYVAWAKGYDFRVLLNQDFPYSGYNHAFLLNLLVEKHQLLESPTWRMGRMISYLPGKVFRLTRKLIQQTMS